jgi:hypothetical protein
MTDKTTSPDGARGIANRDFNLGRERANAEKWNAPLREAYDTEFTRRQQEQNEKKRSGY